MASEIEVLVELLPWLVANNGASTKEVAAKFNISESKVLDLVQLLVLTGPDQGGGGLVDIDFEDSESLFVFDSQDFDKPIQLTNFEASTLLGGLHYLQQISGMSNSETLANLISKLSETLPTGSIPIEVVPNFDAQGITTEIEKAIADQRVLSVRYASLASDAVSDREVEPLAISAIDDHVYLTAWCRKTEDVRTFRLDRIEAISTSDESFNTRVDSEISSIAQGLTAKLIATPKFVRELDPAIIRGTKEIGSDRSEVAIEVFSHEWLAGVILASGGEAEVVEPESLRELVVARGIPWAT